MKVGYKINIYLITVGMDYTVFHKSLDPIQVVQGVYVSWCKAVFIQTF